jgi:hypothetical protein
MFGNSRVGQVDYAAVFLLSRPLVSHGRKSKMLKPLPVVTPSFAPKPQKKETTLTVTRLPGQSVVIDGPARVTARQKGKRTLLDITAPPTTRIIRSELLDTTR